MKKNRTGTWIPFKNQRAKIFLIMKLTLLLVFGFVFTLSASVRAQEQTVTLNVERVSFVKVVSETQLDFFYSFNEVNVNREITLNVKNVKIDDVLRRILGKDFTWEYIDDMVIIKPAYRVVVDSVRKNIRIVGKVTDKAGISMPGVTVKLEGTNLGSATDTKGIFILALPLTKGGRQLGRYR